MTESDARIVRYRVARERVLDRIAGACARCRSRARGDVTLVAVSKTVPADALRDAVAAGLTLLGENRVQEGAAKAPEVPGARWHLVGPLQSNKARRASRSSSRSSRSTRSTWRAGSTGSRPRSARASAIPILLQVNVDDDPAKAGFEPGRARAGDRPRSPELEALDVRGLMTIGRLVDRPEDARPTFRSPARDLGAAADGRAVARAPSCRWG